MEQIKPAFKGTIQVKDSEGKFKPVGTIKLYLCEAKQGEAQPNGFIPMSPNMKGYIGINGKEFYEISLWET